MKKLVLMLLCVGFANFAMANESPNLQIPADANTTLTTQFENIKTLEFPKDEKEEKELDELFKAIETLDSDKIKALVKKNSRLVNLQNKNLDDERYFVPLHNAVLAYGEATNDKAREVALKNIKILLDNKADVNICFYQNQEKVNLNAQIVIDTLYYNNIKLFDFLVENGGLDINHTCDNMHLLAFLFATKEKESKFELFKYMVDKKANPRHALYGASMEEMGEKADLLMENGKYDEMFAYIQTDEYKQRRDIAKKYINEIVTNYSVDDFEISELQLVGMYFIFTKDSEFIKLMIDNGYLKNKVLKEYMLEVASKLKDEDILKIIKGSSDER